MISPVSRSYRWLFWTMAVVGLVVDLGTKYWAFTALYGDGAGGSHVVIENVLSIVAAYPHPTNPDPGDGFLRKLRTVSGEVMPVVNEGALWGRKLGFSGLTANQMFAVVSAIAAAAIIVWSTRRQSAREGWLCFALGLILAGALGNLYDRIVFRGVRDFIYVSWFDYMQWFDFPVFNVADSCLVCGAGALLVQAFFFQPGQEERSAAAATPASGLAIPPAVAAPLAPEPATSE